MRTAAIILSALALLTGLLPAVRARGVVGCVPVWVLVHITPHTPEDPGSPTEMSLGGAPPFDTWRFAAMSQLAHRDFQGGTNEDATLRWLLTSGILEPTPVSLDAIEPEVRVALGFEAGQTRAYGFPSRRIAAVIGPGASSLRVFVTNENAISRGAIMYETQKHRDEQAGWPQFPPHTDNFTDPPSFQVLRYSPMVFNGKVGGPPGVVFLEHPDVITVCIERRVIVQNRQEGEPYTRPEPMGTYTIDTRR